jgi:hypothetical protein
MALSAICFIPVSSAQALYQPANKSLAVTHVYKGELLISVPGEQRDSLLIQYRAKNREVVRVSVSRLELTNTRTKEVSRLSDRSASLAGDIDRDGYWIIDIPYSDLKLGNDNYRVTGRFTQYLVGSQRSTDFSVYLQPKTASKPADSTIDWGIDNDAR